MHRRRRRNEKGQVLPFMGLLVLVVLGLSGLSADIGKILIARAQLGRTVDSAALAGAKQLPNITNATSSAKAFVAANDSDNTITVSVYPDVPSQQVRVVARKTVNTIFMRVFGIKTFTVQNEATAGFGTVPVDAVMAIDATGSMGASPCNSSHNNSGCPIKEAKDAATTFVNTLLPSSATQVGVNSFRGCYKPSGTDSNCVLTSSVGNLTNSASTINTKISALDAVGGTGTNICNGLLQADSILFGTGHSTASNTRRYVIILSDGDNTYNATSYVSGTPGSPPSACRPTTSPSSSDSYTSTGCSSPSGGAPGTTSQTRERQLDTETKAEADALKAAGVEIYIVGLGVCGTDDGKNPNSDSGNYCKVTSDGGQIGNTDPDTVADQRLLKCIASSTNTTNDHYYTTSDPTQLSAIFGQIAQAIAFRLIK
jgi:Flp pilus assembly protein TadG